MLMLVATTAHAEPDKAAFISKVVYRTDGQGDYAFDEIQAPGTYEFTTPHETEGIVYSVTCNYTFTGEVTMEVSTTGKADDYISVVSGVPQDMADYNTGKKLIWRATLGAGSTLTEVAITYMDASGVIGSFGNPALSGFMFRKPIYIRGQGSSLRAAEDGEAISKSLFNYQIPIKIGESSKAKDCGVYLKGVIQSDFADVRFTLADQETIIPHYLESVKGESPDRTALFYVKIPQLPANPLTILYLYYGNPDAADLSDADAVFDFFDDFNGEALDSEKWELSLDSEASVAEVSGSELRLDGAKVTSKAHKLKTGILEYKARSTAAAVESFISGAASGGEDIVMFSSTAAGSEHSIALGAAVKTNSEKSITLNKSYQYQVIVDGENITFKRYDSSGELEAETQYAIRNTHDEFPIGLYATADSLGSYYDYVRVRKYIVSPPEVDTAKTASAREEVPNIAEFNGVTIAANGDLILSEDAIEGEYISVLVNTPFKTRIIIPSWVTQYAIRNTHDDNIAIDISAEEYAMYKQDCVNGAYYYASKKDFTAGDKLRFRVRFAHDASRTTHDGTQYAIRDTQYLSRFTMDFRPGAIELVKPNGGEYLVIGAEYPIIWDAIQYDSNYKMNLAYSVDGGETYIAIAGKVSNSGQYPWLVNQSTGSQNCLVKITDNLDFSIYDLSNDYFSIGMEAAEPSLRGDDEVVDEAIPEAPEAIPQRLGIQLYDLLIKVGDNVGYEEGDIVMVKPAGYIWGAKERNSDKFIIVKAYLTEEEAGGLMKPELGESYDGSGKKVFKIIKRRKHKIDLERQGIIKRNIFGARRLLRSRPLVEKEAIEEKPLKRSTFIERLRKRIRQRGKVIVE